MEYAEKLKKMLLGIVEDMSQAPDLFCSNPGKDFTRKRKLPFGELVRILLSMGGNTLNRELSDFFYGKGELAATSSAFIQQRGKLKWEALQYLLNEFNRLCKDPYTLDGYHVYAADGTDVNIAHNPDSDTYVANGKNKGYNQFHVNTLFDLQAKTYKDCVVQPRPQMDERASLLTMIQILPRRQKSIIVADRGYESLNLFEHIHRIKNVDYVIRVKNTFIKEIAALPMKELDREITINLRGTQTKEDKALYAAGKAKYIKDTSWDFELPFVMTIRVVRFQINESGKDKYETIVTSLNRFEFPLREIKKLYHMRWGIETSFRELKYAVGLTNFHAKKEEFILQEIYARLVIYNFCERITKQVVIRQDEGRKYTYQVNFTMAIHICIRFFRQRGTRPPPERQPSLSEAQRIYVEDEIKRYTLPIRENRHDERKVTPKSNVFFIYRVA